ncbi:hypothetical protein QO004_002931 [Rhizobium mesoamericanum]|nr:hypothetical protein [Rhizobium mesoamericanum]MDQ0561138.1 hypothetical protein [Rhizobium mesoamericanum]
MLVSTFASVVALPVAVAATPDSFTSFDLSVFAKSGGNGCGNGGGDDGENGGSNGGGQGNGSNHGGGSIKSGGPTSGGWKAQGGTKGKLSDAGSKAQSSKPDKAVAAKEKNSSAQLAGLNSLKRSYKAYLHTSDPRMTAIAAHAVAYAQHEIDNGVEPSTDDSVLGDDALEDALASATKTGEVSPATLNQAKDILSVGDANGKIDQIAPLLRRQIRKRQTTDVHDSRGGEFPPGSQHLHKNAPRCSGAEVQ